MITHGKKQISEIVYARKASEGGGAVRLTNIIRGAQVVFGGLEPKTFGWLTKAAGKAILAAFGQTDGKAVIKATNAYLNALAATDPNNASALAGFINEDPMMVCSLVDTGKKRYLSSDGNAKIDLGITWAQANYQCDVEFTFLKVTKSGFLFGTQVWSGSTLLVHANSNGNPTIYASTTKIYTQNEDGTTTVKLVNKSGYKGNSGNRVCLMGFCNGHVVASSWREFKGTIGTNTYNLVPFNGADRIGMLDLDTLTFYPNANTSGSFSIEYTLTDGTPWTPLNQTP